MRAPHRSVRVTSAAAAAATMLVTLAACSSGGDDGVAADGTPSGDFTVSCYDCAESDSVFQVAAQILRDEYPDLDVTVESTSFDQLTTNAQLLFQSDDAPDVALYNQGSASVGNLAATGVLTDLTEVAKEYGWDEVLPSSLQTVSKYDPSTGLMSSDGDWYGLSIQGEYAGLVYYNTDLFEQYGLEIPTTYDELVADMQTFVDNGVTPLATEGAETATQHIWYQLALSQADRSWIDAYQLYEGDVDWGGEELTYATETFADWVEAGYIPSSASGLKSEDMITAFLSGEYPVMISGSWWFNRVNTDSSFDWTVARFPGSTYSLGATGKLWVVPEAAGNKQAAYEYLDILLTDPTVQGQIAAGGGLAYDAPEGSITDPMVEEFQGVFDQLLADDGIALYPDWPSSGMFDQLNSSLQGLINQNLTPDEALDQIEAEYLAGKEALGL
jgi:raffinose/stachyose/melibiose transport system substrate-binding protein